MKYQDFVIKNGKLIGDFEGLYQNFENPWFQSSREEKAFEKFIVIELLKMFDHKKPLELGCGLGFFTNKINSVVESVVGVDISQTAIERAKQLHPDCEFKVSDIDNLEIYEGVDCIMMIEITWYVLEKLEKFKKIITHMKGVGFVHTLTVYPPGHQKYGTEYFTNHEEIMEYFSDVVEILEFGEFSKKEYEGCKRTFFYGIIK